MIHGTNTSNYNQDKYEIKLQKRNSFEIGIVEKNNKFYYCPERLYIELNKFPLENTIKKEAIEKLEKYINPYLLEKLYLKLKSARRGLDNEKIEDFIAKKTFNIKKYLQEFNDKKSIIREYIIALLSEQDNLNFIIKGGSAIELLSSINRSTLDVDSHVDKKEVNKVLSILNNKNNPIYFYVENELNYDKKIITLNLIPKSRSVHIKELINNIKIPLTLNTSYTKEEINEMITIFKLQKNPLKRMKNYSALIFSKEMIIAEKFYSLISKPEHTTRTKDLIDLYLLWDKDIKYSLIIKWFDKKIASNRNPISKEESIQVIKNNKDKDFIKIKNNFNEAIKMYDLKIKYEECIDIYKKIISLFLNNESYNKI